MKIRILLLIGILLTVNGSTYALDTTEAFDRGFSDAELYFGYQGLTDSSELSTVSKEMLIGIGITENFSTSVCFSSESDGYLANAGNDVSLGLFWTALNEDIFKLDFLAATSNSGEISTAIELNLDFDNCGCQLQVEEAIENKDSTERELCTSIVPLVYCKIHNSIDLLSAVNFVYNENDDGDREFDFSSYSFGVNCLISNSVELISQLDFNMTSDDKTISGISFGFVAGI